ncbi:MAG: FISUMP domain-containing protein, partial [Candidatus Saccharibacteria bacterium]|nr:FISUMP domain-containing protein [Candidatus Saccharibacteria bacterium]
TDSSPVSHSTQDWSSSYSHTVPLANRHGKCDPNINGNTQCLSPYQNANYTHYGTTINKYGTPASDSSGTANITYNFGPGGYKIGTYYNYCAASAGYYCYDDTHGAGDSSYDICPAGWKLPTGDASGDFQSLYTKIAGDGTDPTTGITTAPSSATNLLSLQTMLSTPVSGSYYSGAAHRQGTYGFFWSSTFNNTSPMYDVRVSGTAVTRLNNDRRFGLSVRCIAQ